MTVALVLCGLAALGLVGVGIVATLSPRRLAESYGIPVRDSGAYAYVRATGARDAIIGIFFAVAVTARDVRALLCFCIAGLALSLADFSIAYYMGGRRFRGELAAHLGGALGFAVLIVLVLRALQ